MIEEMKFQTEEDAEPLTYNLKIPLDKKLTIFKVREFDNALLTHFELTYPDGKVVNLYYNDDAPEEGNEWGEDEPGNATELSKQLGKHLDQFIKQQKR
ncbi:hypothetical protein FRZ67_19335 [Panacibacter ginsenosidivorans]|uniref:Uncharacterized protein n=1 Tax=Panacibacter ginsenosidivorans TaxID=1813871 RepID=A0A5B8VE88_9BACT|nr:hypothetical protein [Panacibacter ginsenosidivorans]QEC69355.1 hypothetical protein FRZ67_19335 [Panacibacter ginsenosidivorans]